MSYYKSGEILEKAIEIEEKGISFYEALADKSDRDDMRSLFSFLAGEERSHKESFTELLEKAGEFKNDFGFDYYDYMAGMQFLSDEGIFEDDKKTVKQAFLTKDTTELIRTAIQFEQDSILYYNEMRPIVDSAGTKMLDEIIGQERTHIVKLKQILSDLGKE